MRTLFTGLIVLIPALLFAQSFPSSHIQKTLDKSINNKRIFGAVVSISTEDETHHFASGNMKVGDSYFIASVSKLYTAAVLFQLMDLGKINLDDSIKHYLPEHVLHKLHICQNIDYSNDITIRHLVTNTSGLADYFLQDKNDGNNLLDYLVSNGDTSLTFEQIIERTKELPSKFPPGTPGKAYYSDGNFQLLGKIIENVTGKPMHEVYEELIFGPLALEQTYLYHNPSDTTPSDFYHKDQVLCIPKMMASFQADGGIVSTTEETLIFLRAHLNRELHSQDFAKLNSGWNKINSPFQYGHGIMRFKYFGVPEMIGHSGANGSFAFYVPSKRLYITGTINQIDKPQLAYRLIAKILAKI